MKWSKSPHRPPHLYVDDAWYFVTASTVDQARILASDEHLDLWVNIFKGLITEFKLKVAAWVVLANHYHFLFLPQRGYDLGIFMKRFNGRTSYELNTLDKIRGRSVWYSYWDTCIRGERDFWTRFNYIHSNPVKHGYVQKPEDWHYSSYRYYLRTDGGVWLKNNLQDFPIYDLFDDDKF
ncbi:MAG TPA: transposase [Anaerolineales bacterium]|nr:transposase [Anaerolineales bacterium]